MSNPDINTKISNYFIRYFLENPITSIVSMSIVISTMMLCYHFGKAGFFPLMSHDMLCGLLAETAVITIFTVGLTLLVFGLSTILYRHTLLFQDHPSEITRSTHLWFFLPCFISVLLSWLLVITFLLASHWEIIATSFFIALLLLSIPRKFIRNESWSSSLLISLCMGFIYILSFYITGCLATQLLSSITSPLIFVLLVPAASLIYLTLTYTLSLLSLSKSKSAKNDFIRLLILIVIGATAAYSGIVFQVTTGGPRITKGQHLALLVDKTAIAEIKTLTNQSSQLKQAPALLNNFKLIAEMSSFVRISMKTTKNCPNNQSCHVTFNLSKHHAKLVTFSADKK